MYNAHNNDLSALYGMFKEGVTSVSQASLVYEVFNSAPVKKLFGNV